MSKIFNMDEATEATTILPKGRYMLRVTDIKEKVSAKSGNEYWSVRLGVVNNEQYKNWSVFDNWVFSQKAVNRLKLINKAFRKPITGNFEFKEDEFIGKCVMADVTQETYTNNNGEVINKNAISFTGYVPMSKEMCEIANQIESTPLPEKQADLKPYSAADVASENTNKQTVTPVYEDIAFEDIPF